MDLHDSLLRTNILAVLDLMHAKAGLRQSQHIYMYPRLAVEQGKPHTVTDFVQKI
jgi:O-phosphoseryl-tRNA(Cys) synthetase